MRHITTGEFLIREGSDENSVFFIVAGTFSIVVHGHTVNTRGPSETVGEIAAIDSSQPRSANVVADVDAVVLELTEPQLADIASRNPFIWKSIAIDMARRLVERNALVASANDQIRVFIMSSAEGLPVAREIQTALSHGRILPIVWTNGVFWLSDYPLDSLEEALDASDFAIAVAHPDDTTESRGQVQKSPRDNVIFELGLFMGRLTRQRTVLVEPREGRIKLPSDLRGITTAVYRNGNQRDLAANLGPACTEIIKLIEAAGPK